MYIPLIIIAAISVLIVVMIGVILPVFGNKINKKYSTKLMIIRVVLQAVIIFTVITVILLK